MNESCGACSGTVKDECNRLFSQRNALHMQLELANRKAEEHSDTLVQAQIDHESDIANLELLNKLRGLGCGLTIQQIIARTQNETVALL